jgi:hypothetical protein
MTEILFYHYYFAGIEKPLVIQAINQQQARAFLLQCLSNNAELAEYAGKEIIQQSVSHPVVNVSKRKIGNDEYVWVGLNEKDSENGWKKQSPR